MGFNIGKVGAVCSTIGGVGEGGGGVPISDNYGHEQCSLNMLSQLLFALCCVKGRLLVVC